LSQGFWHRRPPPVRQILPRFVRMMRLKYKPLTG
jgi:hypothetical protein